MTKKQNPITRQAQLKQCVVDTIIGLGLLNDNETPAKINFPNSAGNTNEKPRIDIIELSSQNIGLPYVGGEQQQILVYQINLVSKIGVGTHLINQWSQKIYEAFSPNTKIDVGVVLNAPLQNTLTSDDMTQYAIAFTISIRYLV